MQGNIRCRIHRIKFFQFPVITRWTVFQSSSDYRIQLVSYDEIIRVPLFHGIGSLKTATVVLVQEFDSARYSRALAFTAVHNKAFLFFDAATLIRVHLVFGNQSYINNYYFDIKKLKIKIKFIIKTS